LEISSVVLLLISPSFLASWYCYSAELTQALRRASNGEATVIPVILHPSDWRTHSLGELQEGPVGFSSSHVPYLLNALSTAVEIDGPSPDSITRRLARTTEETRLPTHGRELALWLIEDARAHLDGRRKSSNSWQSLCCQDRAAKPASTVCWRVLC